MTLKMWHYGKCDAKMEGSLVFSFNTKSSGNYKTLKWEEGKYTLHRWSKSSEIFSCHQPEKPGKPEKVRELKFCLKSQRKVREFIRKMAKSVKCQGIWKLVLFKHVTAYLFLVNLFFDFRAVVLQENLNFEKLIFTCWLCFLLPMKYY